MNLNKDNMLIIGSIVKLKDSDLLFMIEGYSFINKDNKVYDYSGCIYPQGVSNHTNDIVFNSDSIEEVVYSGFENGQSLKFKEEYTKCLSDFKENNMLELLQEANQ